MIRAIAHAYPFKFVFPIFETITRFTLIYVWWVSNKTMCEINQLEWLYENLLIDSSSFAHLIKCVLTLNGDYFEVLQSFLIYIFCPFYGRSKFFLRSKPKHNFGDFSTFDQKWIWKCPDNCPCNLIKYLSCTF